jgi:hypothetical protein
MRKFDERFGHDTVISVVGKFPQSIQSVIEVFVETKGAKQ